MQKYNVLYYRSTRASDGNIKGPLGEKVENFEGREFLRENIVIKRPLLIKDSTIGRHVH